MKPLQLAKRVARDRGIKAGVVRDGNTVSRAVQAARFGWMIPYLSKMGKNGNWALSCNPNNKIVIGNNYPLTGNWNSPAALMNAAAVAVAGQSGKTTAAASWPATPAAVTLTLTANTVSAFGVFIRVSDSLTNFRFATYEAELFNGSTLIAYVELVVTTLPAEFFILNIANNVGNANIIPNTSPVVTFPYSATAGAIGNTNAGAMNTGNVMYAETINMRDIQQAMQAIDGGQILV